MEERDKEGRVEREKGIDEERHREKK